MSNNSVRFGNLLVITAPSGAGKSTLVARLLSQLDDVAFSISYTTRAPRATEIHGREYYFVSVAQFEDMRDNNEFLEYACVHNNYYGTHRDQVKATLDQGKDILLDIDVQGAALVKKAMPQAVLIFILPPSFAVLSERLNKRGLDSKEVIERRLKVAADEVARYREFDYAVVNDDLETAARALESIVRAERQRPERCEPTIQEILTSFRNS